MKYIDPKYKVVISPFYIFACDKIVGMCRGCKTKSSSLMFHQDIDNAGVPMHYSCMANMTEEERMKWIGDADGT